MLRVLAMLLARPQRRFWRRRERCASRTPRSAICGRRSPRAASPRPIWCAPIRRGSRPMTAPARALNCGARDEPRCARDRGGLDAGEAGERRPLEGIPILIKDNIATGDTQHTTAGSLALADAQRERDATVGAAAARGRRGDPRQGQPDRVRQHPGDRHAVRLLLARRPGEKPLRAATRRRGHADRLARRVEFGLGGRGRGRALRRRRSAPRPRARCCRRPTRTASSPSSRRSG